MVGGINYDSQGNIVGPGGQMGGMGGGMGGLGGLGGFDAAAYLAANPDVAAAPLGPEAHYRMFGQKEGRPLRPGDGQSAAGAMPAAPPAPSIQSASAIPTQDPSQGFDPQWYLKAYPDVAAAGVDPLRHYLSTGIREGRSRNAYEASGKMAPSQPNQGQTPASATLQAGNPSSLADFLTRGRAQTAGLNRLPTMAPTSDHIPNDPVRAKAMFTGMPPDQSYLNIGALVQAGKNGGQFAAGLNQPLFAGTYGAKNLGMGL